MLKNWGRVTLLIALTYAHVSVARFIRVPFEGIRPTGMGNAYLGLADDQNALWYNPAGLAKIDGVHSNTFDFITGFDSTRTSNAIWKAATDTNNYDSVVRMNDKQFARFGLFPTLITKYFGFGFYQNLQAFTDFGGLVLPEVDIYFANDLAAIMGFAFPFSEYFSAGISVRLLQRSGVDASVTPGSLLSALGTTEADFNAAAFTHLKNLAGLGWGYGVNAGVLIDLPTKWPRIRLAATAEDITDTKFRRIGNNALPANIPASYHMGLALLYDYSRHRNLKVALDLRNLFKGNPWNKMLHAGAEYEFYGFQFRLGAYQGYLTGGIGIKALPHTRIHASTYAVELGTALWERSARWYLLQVSIGFDPL